jgi:hypothetical protein
MGWNGYPSESATLTKAPKIGRLEGTTPNGGEMLKETSVDWPVAIVILGVGKVTIPKKGC